MGKPNEKIDRQKLLDYLDKQIEKYRSYQTPIEKLKLGEDIGAMRGAKNALKNVVKFIDSERSE